MLLNVGIEQSRAILESRVYTWTTFLSKSHALIFPTSREGSSNVFNNIHVYVS